MIALWWSLLAGAAPCDLAAPPDAPFGVRVRADRVLVVVELWADGAPNGWVDSVLRVLEARSLSGVVVVSTGPLDAARTAVLARAAAGPHEVGVRLQPDEVPRDVLARVSGLRAKIKPLRQVAGKLVTVYADIGSRASEAMLGRAGFHVLMHTAGPPTAQPRLAGHLQGQPPINLVVLAGEYEGPCGAQPEVGAFTPRAADRAAEVIQRAQLTPVAPIVRVALGGTRASTSDAAVLGRWLDEVVTPGGARVVLPNQARVSLLPRIRRGRTEVAEDDLDAGGRVISFDDAQAAARSLTRVPLLPRALPGGLSPAEAFYAFALIAEAPEPPTSVRIGALRGPFTESTSGIGDGVFLPASDVRNTARSLLAALPDEVPAALPVGDTLLTATELLIALAGVVRGEDPVQVTPISVPEPNQAGLGWGEASLP